MLLVGPLLFPPLASCLSQTVDVVVLLGREHGVDLAISLFRHGLELGLQCGDPLAVFALNCVYCLTLFVGDDFAEIGR